MTPEEIKKTIAKQAKEGLGVFSTIVTATEIILGSEYLVEQIKQSRKDDRRYSIPEIKHVVGAFAIAQQRYKTLKERFAHQLQGDTYSSDWLITPQFARARQRDLILPGSITPIKSVPELLSRANIAQDIFLANASDPPEFLSPFPDNSGPAPGGGEDPGPEDPPPPTESTGGSVPDGGFDSFDQYPQEIQKPARAAYGEIVEPQAQGIINDAMGIIIGGGSIPIGDVSSAVAGAVIAGAAAIGGPVGAALTALAELLIPRMLAAFEDWLVGQALESGGI